MKGEGACVPRPLPATAATLVSQTDSQRSFLIVMGYERDASLPDVCFEEVLLLVKGIELVCE
jgi:hypothetical protein